MNQPPEPPMDYGIPEDPFHPPKEQQQPARRRRMDRARAIDAPVEPPVEAPAARPSVTLTADGSQFTPPASAQIPDWLRTAQQLNPSVQERPRAPRVRTAPQYRDAEPVPIAPPPRVEAEPEEEPPIERPAPPAWLTRVPWLGLCALAMLMAAITVWLMGLSFETQRRRTLEEREARELALYDTYPLKYEALIAEKAEKYNLSPAFVAAIMLNESSFRPDATSSVDARGLMQLMNDTASWIHDKLRPSEPYDFQNLYDPETNAEFGCWYLRFLANRFRGDPILVAAAFHAGQGEVQNWLNSSLYSDDRLTIALDRLPEGPTRQYVTRVLNAYAAYKRLYYGG